jgi:hypothetical protein
VVYYPAVVDLLQRRQPIITLRLFAAFLLTCCCCCLLLWNRPSDWLCSTYSSKQYTGRTDASVP